MCWETGEQVLQRRIPGRGPGVWTECSLVWQLRCPCTGEPWVGRPWVSP